MKPTPEERAGWQRLLPPDGSHFYQEFWYLDAVRRLDAEVTRLEKQNELQGRIVVRLPLCADHRDKVRDVCATCQAEEMAMAVVRLVDAIRPMHPPGAILRPWIESAQARAVDIAPKGGPTCPTS
jgi:hypothetical protein